MDLDPKFEVSFRFMKREGYEGGPLVTRFGQALNLRHKLLLNNSNSFFGLQTMWSWLHQKSFKDLNAFFFAINEFYKIHYISNFSMSGSNCIISLGSLQTDLKASNRMYRTLESNVYSNHLVPGTESVFFELGGDFVEFLFLNSGKLMADKFYDF